MKDQPRDRQPRYRNTPGHRRSSGVPGRRGRRSPDRVPPARRLHDGRDARPRARGRRRRHRGYRRRAEQGPGQVRPDMGLPAGSQPLLHRAAAPQSRPAPVHEHGRGSGRLRSGSGDHRTTTHRQVAQRRENRRAKALGHPGRNGVRRPQTGSLPRGYRRQREPRPLRAPGDCRPRDESARCDGQAIRPQRSAASGAVPDGLLVRASQGGQVADRPTGPPPWRRSADRSSSAGAIRCWRA